MGTQPTPREHSDHCLPLPRQGGNFRSAAYRCTPPWGRQSYDTETGSPGGHSVAHPQEWNSDWRAQGLLRAAGLSAGAWEQVRTGTVSGWQAELCAVGAADQAGDSGVPDPIPRCPLGAQAAQGISGVRCVQPPCGHRSGPPGWACPAVRTKPRPLWDYCGCRGTQARPGGLRPGRGDSGQARGSLRSQPPWSQSGMMEPRFPHPSTNDDRHKHPSRLQVKENGTKRAPPPSEIGMLPRGRPCCAVHVCVCHTGWATR